MDLYVAYRDYITVEQVSGLLSAVDGIYDALFYLEAPDQVGTPVPSASKLRVDRAETGHSILFEVVQGVQQTYHAIDPMLRGVGGAAGILGTTAAVLTRAFREGSAALTGHRRDKMELATRESRSALELRSAESRVLVQEAASAAIVRALTETPPETDRVDITALAGQMVAPLTLALEVLGQDNISKVTVDGRPLLDRGAL
jgi:hypothetical protein